MSARSTIPWLISCIVAMAVGLAISHLDLLGEPNDDAFTVKTLPIKPSDVHPAPGWKLAPELTDEESLTYSRGGISATVMHLEVHGAVPDRGPGWDAAAADTTKQFGSEVPGYRPTGTRTMSFGGHRAIYHTFTLRPGAKTTYGTAVFAYDEGERHEWVVAMQSRTPFTPATTTQAVAFARHVIVAGRTPAAAARRSSAK